MTRALFTLLGATVFALAAYGLVELFAAWYGPRYIRSDSDIGEAFMASLAFIVASLIAGGVAGFRLSGRKTWV